MAQHTKNSCVCVCCNRSHFRWLSRFAGVKMDVTDEKLEYGAATSGTTDCESLFSFLSFFVCVCACPFSLSLLNLLFFVPVLFFFFFSGLGFLSIIPWMDRHVFFFCCWRGFELSHFYIFVYLYSIFVVLFGRRKMEFHSCGMVPLSWDVCQPRFVHPSMDTVGPLLSDKKAKKQRDPQKGKTETKRRRKEAFVITSQRPNASVCVWPCVLVAAPYFSVSLVYRHRFFLGFYFLIPFEDGHQPCVLFLFSFFIFYLFFFFFFFFCRASAFTHGGSLRDGMTDRISTCLDWKR